jgi:glycosyltransferase involved in cell wall biosynthesis
VYDDYGAQEWITNGLNGWVVKSVEEMISIINDLKNNPLKLEAISQEAIKLAVSFDWKVRVKDWEEVIMQLANERN